MTLNMKNRCAIFFWIEDLYRRANLCENNFHPVSIKNDNESIEARKIVGRERNQQLHQLKKLELKGIEEFLNCALTFLFLCVSSKLKKFCVTQNHTPKMVKNDRLYY